MPADWAHFAKPLAIRAGGFTECLLNRRMHENAFDMQHSEMKGLVQLVESMERAMADGLIRPVASALELSVMLWAQVHGIASLRIAHPEMPWPTEEEQVYLMFQCFAEGMCTKGAPVSLRHF